jgi:hypothetical protein
MTSRTVETLFDEFATQYARGERPDIRAYLERAGNQADQLGLLIDRYLQAVPAQPPDEETVVLMEARLDHVPPLAAARTRRGLKVRELSDRLRDALGLGEPLGDRVEDAYSELERGQLDTARVDERVWEALRTLLGLDARRLAFGLRSSTAPLAYYREAAPAAEAFNSAQVERPSRAPDEVDRLFGTHG